MAFKFAITKAGSNVLTETDVNDFIFNSDYNTFKILVTGTYAPTLAHNGTTETSTSLAHGLSYTPFIIPFVKFANSRCGPPGTRASNVDFWFTNCKADGTNIKFFYINNTGGNYTPTFRYYVVEPPL